jgi:hypothetical protein
MSQQHTVPPSNSGALTADIPASGLFGISLLCLAQQAECVYLCSAQNIRNRPEIHREVQVKSLQALKDENARLKRDLEQVKALFLASSH